MILALVLSIVPQALPGAGVPAAEAHNLQTRMVYMFFDPETQDMLDGRAATALPGTPMLQADDEIGLIIKVVPRDGTTTGVGGHIDFYVPNGMQVVDVGYVVPDSDGGYEKVAMKGQSPIAIGAGPIGSKTTTQLIGLTDVYASPVSDLSSTAVNPATGLHWGTLAGVYGDTGIFYSTDPNTAYGSWQALTGASTANGCGALAFNPSAQGARITNNSGDVVVPCNAWDAGQLFAWGVKGTTYSGAGASSAPIVDYGDGRGNAPWGFASGVAGPQSGYAWAFDWDEWRASAQNAAAMRAAMDAAGSVGPWQRIQYDGSRLSYDQPGLASTVIGYANRDASTVGRDLAANPLPVTDAAAGQTDLTSPKAIRWAVGQLTAFRPEYAWVKVKVTEDTSEIDDNTLCTDFNLRADTFGGDAGGTDNGKDHLWRYYEPTEVKMNMCIGVGKPATKEFVTTGTVFQYPVQVYNLQNFTLTNVVVRDTLGSGLTFLSASPAQTSGPNPLVWNVGTLQPGQKFESLLTVRATTSGFLDNCVTVTSDQLPPQSSCDTTISGQYPFLVPSKTASVSSANPGDTVRYDMLISNIGTGPTGNPVTVREFLPEGFTYDPTFSPVVRVNGALVTPTVNVSNPREPIFTIPAAIQAENRLTITFRANISPAAEPGSYCNTYSVTQNGVPITTGSLACVTVGGGQIGDTIFRDWNGNGVQDPDEEGMPGVTVTLQGSSPATSCFPTACTTVTDANGNYIFAGLLPGSYTVSVPNPGSGGVPSGFTLTADPDGSPATTSYVKNLAPNEVFLGADWGYKPGGTGVIGDQVFEDVANNGVFDTGIDSGISGVTVYLYEDSDGDGVITPGVDALVATATTGANGIYSFTGLAEGFDYIAYVDPADTALTTYFGAPFQASTSNPQTIPNLSGTYNDADFGFWEVAPGSIGDQVFIDNDGDGVYDPLFDTPLAGVTVNLYLNSVLVGTTTSGPDGTYLFDNLGPGDYRVEVDANDPDVPTGYFPSVQRYSVTLGVGQDFLNADFPFVPLLIKAVDLASANAGDTLTFTITPQYPGSNPLTNVQIVDTVPTGTTFVSAGQGGSNVPPVTWNLGSTTAPVNGTTGGGSGGFVTLNQWASRVEGFSSQFSSTGWSAAQALGAPNTFACGDINTAWAPNNGNPASVEFLHLGYTTPVYATGVRIRETGERSQTVGFVTGVTLIEPNGTQHPLTIPADNATCAGYFEITFPQTSYLVDEVRITTVTPDSGFYEEIDAVELLGAVVSNGGGQIEFIGNSTDGNNDGTSVMLTKPAGTSAGDLLLAAVSTRRTGSTITPPTGWTQIRNSDNDTDNLRMVTFRKFAGASEPASYTFTIANGERSAAGLSVYRNVAAATPVNAENAQASSGETSSVVAPSVTTTVANTRLVAFFNTRANEPVTSVSPAMTFRYFAQSGPETTSSRVRVTTYDATFVGPGATGTRTASLAAARYNIGALIALTPAGPAYQTTTALSADRSLVTTGDTVTVTLTASATGNAGTVTPGALTANGTNGASASCGSASPATAVINNGSATFTYTCSVTAGSQPGVLTFKATPTDDNGDWAEGTANTVLITPPLTFQVTVNNPPPASGVITNTAAININGDIFPSNTTQTATAGSIGDRVWNDLDGDGVQDAGEPGLAGVRVYVDSNNNGQWDPGEPFDITDAAGAYRIFSLPAGTYTVRTDPATYPTGFLPTTPPVLSVTLTTGQQVNDADFGLNPPGTGSIGDSIWLDADNDGIQDPDEDGLPGIDVNLEINIDGNWYPVSTTTTDANGGYTFPNLTAGDYRVTVDTASQVSSPYAAGTFDLGDVMAPTWDYDDPTMPIGTPNVALVTLPSNSTVMNTVDFGYNWSGSIGDFVWWDDNTNGLQDENPLVGAPDARVQLYFDANGDGVFSPLDGDFEIKRVFTDEDGYYLFQNLPPGVYIVDVYEDSLTPNGVRDVVPTTVDQLSVVLTPENMAIDTADFGYYRGARVQGSVYHDNDRNGIREPGEIGLAGIVVTLTGFDKFGNPVSETTTTDVDGNFIFIVPAGDYTLTYSTSQTTAAGFPDATTPTSFTFEALAGEDWYEQNRFDFGVDFSGRVGDRVWNDADGNGSQDAGELGIAGVTVSLSVAVVDGKVDVNGDGVIDSFDDGILGGRTVTDGVIYEGASPMNGVLFGVTVIDGLLDINGDSAVNNFDDGLLTLATTATDANGEYLFQGLPDGTYVVTVNPASLPSGFVQTYDNIGGLDNTGRGVVSGGGADLTADFGYRSPASYTVSGRVFDDLNTSGTYDSGEGLEDVAVCLYDSAGVNVVACTVTDANGFYAFPGIPNGSYIVRVDTSTLPSTAYAQTVDPDGTLNNETPVTVNNADVVDRNFGYELRPGAISGAICDGDGDGLCNDPGDAPLEGVTVILTWAGPDGILGTPDDVTYSDVTDVNGAYSFTDLEPGRYQITKINPPDYPFSIADADGGNPNSITVVLAVNQIRTNQDFEVDPALSSIGDRVWLDENGDGVQDAGEAGIANVTVQLFDDANNLIATTVTDSNGNYIFTGLLPGDYVVTVDTTSLAAGLAANPTYDYDGIATPHTTAMTLAAGQEFGEADFGYNWVSPDDSQDPEPGATGAIGDRVWVDADGDGVQDPGEPGLAGVSVELYSDPDGDGVYDTLAATTATDANGNYIFDDLAAGAYVVVVNDGNPPAGYTQTGDPDGTLDNQTTQPVILAPGDVFVNADFGYEPSQSSTIGDLIYLDLDGDGQHDAGEPGIPGVTVALLDNNGDVIASTITDGDGNYVFPGLPVGDYTVWVNDTANVLGQLVQTGDPDATLDDQHTLTVDGASDYLDNDFGYAPAGQTPATGLIGDTIFLDRDGNDAFGPGEGLEGVTVRLYNATGTIVLATTTTDENGNYYFGGLASGTYVVDVDTTTLPNGGVGLTNTVDPDTTAPGDSQSTVVLGGVDPMIQLDQDFGYAADTPNTISGAIWNDVDADGALDGVETGRYEGVTVVLYDGDGNVVATTTTDASGNYSFTGLPDGSYTVDVTDDGNVLNGLWHSLGTPDTAGQSQTDPYTVAVSGGGSYVVDYGYYSAPAALGDFVWDDLNANGIQDSGEPGLAGVLVTLTILYPNGDTTTVTTVTDANGFYSFGNLLLNENYNASTAGDPAVVGLPGFTISVATPDGYAPTLTGVGSNPAVDSNNPAGTVPVVVQGQYDDTFDFGFRAGNETYAINDINQTPVNVPVGGNVLTNDYDLEGDNQTVISALADTDGDGQVDDNLPIGVATPIYATGNDGNVVPAGTITLNPDGTYTYTPATDFTGTVPVVYTLTDDNTLPATDTATLTIEVVGDTPSQNDPPVAQDDTASTEQGVPVSGNVLGNDSDPDGDPITVTDVLMDTDGDGLADDPVTPGVPTPVYGTDENGNIVPAGTLVINTDGTWTFTPNPGFTGDVPAEYTIEDPGGLSDDATLTITIVPDLGNETFANDDANLGPQGVAQTGNILDNDFDPEGNDQDVTLVDTDGDGTPDTAPVAGTPIVITQNGNPIGTLTVDPETGAYIWQPAPTFVGTAVIPYEACDDGTPQACATATLYLTTLPSARPDVTPIITAIPNVMTGVTQFNLTVRVLELNQVPTSGLITVRIPKDIRWGLAVPYDPTLTLLGAIPVNNTIWSFSENATHYIFQTTTTIPAGGFSTFGVRALWDAGPNQGQYTITSQIDSFSGNETRIDNNSDAEKIDYFIN
jgi:uncharacterized repeat protein (TIGR01451 family)